MDTQGFITKYATPQNLIIVALIIVIVVIIYRSRHHARAHACTRANSRKQSREGNSSSAEQKSGDDLLASLVDNGTVTTPDASSE